MKILCTLLGHRSRGYYSWQPGYADPPSPVVWTDGTGRGHVELKATCDRCAAKFHVISFHPPREWVDAMKGDPA